MRVNIPPAPEEPVNGVVLLVEDDLINQITIKRFIDNKYTTVITDSSDEALEILKKKKIDLILMDISIRGKKNGLELTKELKASKEFSHIPVIAVTAHAFEKDKQNALEAGCDSYLAKPFTKESLLNMMSIYANK
jgi:CheY-like chemotaxis protein